MDRKVPEAYYIKEGTRVGSIFSSPIKVDYVNENNIYLGYTYFEYESLAQSEKLLIKNITDDTVGNITIRYAYGAWADRETLTYI